MCVCVCVQCDSRHHLDVPAWRLHRNYNGDVGRVGVHWYDKNECAVLEGIAQHLGFCVVLCIIVASSVQHLASVLFYFLRTIKQIRLTTSIIVTKSNKRNAK